MTISPAAAEIIRDRLQRSGVRDPVIRLVQAVSDTPPAVDEAVERGARPDEILKLIREAPLQTYLLPGIYHRRHHLWFVDTIAGFPFALHFFQPRVARLAMRRGVLDAAQKGLVLRDADGTVVLPKPGPSAP